jgi:DNA mismatch repair protein MutH
MAAAGPKNTPAWHHKFYHPLPYDPSSEQSILSFAGLLVQRRLGEQLVFWPIGPTNGKGKFGAVLEEFYFYKKPDAISEADFPAGIELKTAPLRLLATSGFSVKERISLSMINYLDLPKETFEASTFLKKNARILLVFYLYIKDQLPTDALVQNVYYWRIPAEDLPVIREDWALIHSKVAANRAMELSEGHTRYLGACTKGAGRGQQRRQADSTTAKPRAFSLKRSYVQHIYDKYVLGSTNAVPVIKKGEPRKTFEEIIRQGFEKFYGLTGAEIAARLGMDTSPSAKNFNAIVTKRLFKIPEDVEIEEFKKAGIVTKTMRVKSSGVPKEHVSFPYFKPMELVEEEWEDASVKSQLSSRFFFVIYVEDEEGNYRLRDVRFWAMPDDDIEKHAKSVWAETRKRVSSATPKQMPGASFDEVVHVRPHGRDGTDDVATPGGWRMTKACFWLHAKYISKQLNLPELAG